MKHACAPSQISRKQKITVVATIETDMSSSKFCSRSCPYLNTSNIHDGTGLSCNLFCKPMKDEHCPTAEGGIFRTIRCSICKAMTAYEDCVVRGDYQGPTFEAK